MSMQITLSNTPASEKWGKKAILSANENGMTIHLNEKSAKHLSLSSKPLVKLKIKAF